MIYIQLQISSIAPRTSSPTKFPTSIPFHVLRGTRILSFRISKLFLFGLTSILTKMKTIKDVTLIPYVPFLYTVSLKICYHGYKLFVFLNEVLRTNSFDTCIFSITLLKFFTNRIILYNKILSKESSSFRSISTLSLTFSYILFPESFTIFS